MVTLTAGQVASVAGGELLQGNPYHAIGRVSIDSRSLAAGDFFVAIRGERFDGHQFVAAALARGAAGVLVESVPADVAVRGGDSAPAVIRASDTTAALQRVANDVRR